MKHPVHTTRTENVDMNIDLDVDMDLLKYGMALSILRSLHSASR